MQEDLTVEVIRDQWERIRRRIRTVRDGAKVSALLSGCVPVMIEQEAKPPCLVLQAMADFHFKNLQPYVEQGIVTKVIIDVVGQPCQLRIDPPRPRPPLRPHAGKLASEMSHQSDPPQEHKKHRFEHILSRAEIFTEWEEIVQAVCYQPHGSALGSALKRCKPQRVEMQETPGLLILQTKNESAATLLKDATNSAMLPLTLLPVLGRVYRVQVQLIHSDSGKH
ncbi:hypothetical protein [Dictyobacter arantiisoli]|uniref:Uncharacterized protein n=1 Tax=Dictyobacter arantiisoli TaxID=2014874 RepID=A0A5A5TGE8_9CHLR|nr:hypothetical protein [Dictyobacter arantiisoli]GCF09994.1 hypothetical protein KDI_35580 [Dictyobacter arantiisoli]